MVRPPVDPQDAIIETWEIAFPGTVWVWVYDRREDVYKKQAIGARYGSRSIHLTRDDRKYNQELVPEENKHLDVFTNGCLRLLGSANRDESLDVRNHYSRDDLIAMFEVRDPDLFAEAMEALTSEVVLRRLVGLADDHGTVTQGNVLRDIIAQRYPVGGTQLTVREMIEAGEKIGATRI
jgi:hypothetical protein